MRRPALIVAATGLALVALGVPLAHPAARANGPAVRALSWSPDGRRVAFVSGRTLRAATLGGRVDRIATVLDVGQPYHWLPRTTTLVYATPSALVRSSADGRRRLVLASGSFRFTEPCCFVSNAGRGVFDVRRDGALVVAKRARRRCTEFFTVDTRTRRTRRLLCDADSCPRCNPGHPRWVGTRLVALLEVREGRGYFSSLLDATTRRTALRLDTPRVLEAPAWTADRTRVAYTTRPVVSIPESPAQVRLRVVPRGSDVEAGAGANPRWSPDAARLALERPQGVVTTVVRADASARHELRQTTGLAWSPDGRRTAFVVKGSLAVGDADGRHATKLVSATQSFAAAPAWSPDGRWIAFARSDDPGIWIVRPDGSGLRRLARP